MSRLTKSGMRRMNAQFKKYRFTRARGVDRHTSGQLCVNGCLDFILRVIDEEDLNDMDGNDARLLAKKATDACLRKCRQLLEG
jgi:hypothetical protein